MTPFLHKVRVFLPTLINILFIIPVVVSSCNGGVNLDKNSLLRLLGIIIALIFGYFILTHISFEQEEEFGNFPIPKGAKVIKEEKNFIAYSWSKASEEDGIPKRYQKELEKEGWEIDWSEGAGTIYKKNNIRVLLICSTRYLSISLAK